MEMNSFGKNLQLLLNKANMSEHELAYACGISPSTISRYVTDTREPRLSRLVDIREALGCTWDEMIYGVYGCDDDDD